MITRGNSFKLRLCYVFLEDTKYMTILTRQEKERLVLDLYYNQGKTYREIAKRARISPHNIGIILNKTFEEKSQEEVKEQQDDAEKSQELADKKVRIEKLIANIQNGEGYSKLKQIVKKSVKAILSDNKKLISVSFAALIQTLKANPQMVKLIQNIPSANDGGEQHKENNNNAIRYLEFHKNSLSDLIEKHYENLVEALTNDSISSAAVFSSNPTISLPSPSSSTFSAPPDQSDIYGIEKSESFHNNKGDIAD